MSSGWSRRISTPQTEVGGNDCRCIAPRATSLRLARDREAHEASSVLRVMLRRALQKSPLPAKPRRSLGLNARRVIDGLGQEAYWMGSSITGALYVLKGDAFLRISIRGGENTSQRHGPTN